MSLPLSNLLLCCRGLENDRATERKKAADQFRRLIRSPEVMQELDRTSGCKTKGSNQLTWDAVFRFLQRYIQRETESMQSSKSNVTASTLTTRQKKMAEMCSLIKYFIRCANKRGPRLKCSELLKHMTEVMQSSYSCAAYGEDYSSLLVKDILSVRKYWCDIAPRQWHNLLELYCHLFVSPSKPVNRVLVSRVIHMLVQGCCMQTEGFHNTLFRFFSEVLLAKQEKHLTVLEHLVSALNIFVRSVAMNHRMRVCYLGELLVPALLCIWADMRPSLALKEGIVEFFNLQICAHHPKGARTQETGAYAEDWSRWRNLLYSLYDALIGEISQIGSRGKYVTGSRHIAVKENLIQLTAHICHQLFSDSSDPRGLEVTQGSCRGSASKRRRIELGWEVLREHLQPQHSDFDLIPWLQITAVLTSTHPSMLPGRELLLLLASLYQLLAEQKRGERGPYVLRCLKGLARCQTNYPNKAQVHRSELSRLWARVCALALRGVSSPQSEALSLDLLRVVVHGGLISVDRELWMLFSGSVCKPSLAAALCLAQALVKCPLPKSIASPSDCRYVGLTDRIASPNLKETLIAWLLMTDQSDEMEENSKPHPIICRDFPYDLIANILVSLTMKDTGTVLRFLMGSDEVESSFYQEQHSPDGKTNLEEMELLFLQFSFNTLPTTVGGTHEKEPLVSSGGQFTAAPHLRNKLEELMLLVADNLLLFYVPDAPSTPPECLVRCVGLLTGVLAAYISTGVMSEKEACCSQIFSKAKVLLQELSSFVFAAKMKMTEKGSMNPLRSVMKLCTQSSSRNEKDKVFLASSRLFVLLLPASLLNDLAYITKLLSSSVSGKVTVTDDNDCMEEDWDLSRTQNEKIDLFDEGIDVHSGSSNSNGATGQKMDNSDSMCGPGAKSLLSEDHLAQQDLLFLAVLDFLCECGSVQPIHGLLFKPQEVRQRLLLLLKQMDFSKALHLSMYLVLLKKLPTEHSLAPEEFDALLHPLADLCSDYHQDQDICAAVLLGLLPSIRSLGESHHPPEEMRHVQGSLLQVVSGFCYLSQTGKCVAAVRVALVQCLVALLEADPRCNWAILSLKDHDGTENDIPVSAILSSHLADAHHQVRMLIATSVERLFLEVQPNDPDQRRMLPLKRQQEAFESIYLKAQEGMKFLTNCSSEDQQDESFNRKAALLKSLSVVLCCSPVCEKQALFALFQSYKENNIEEQLIKKILGSVCRVLGYSSVKSLVTSHLYYLVAEWLAQRQSDDRYTLGSFPYTVLDQETVRDFYRSSYQVLIPHLVFLDDFEQVKSIGRCLERDWKDLLADCFPKIMVNILPYFALCGQDALVAQQREKAHRVYDLLKDSSYLGKQEMDNLIHSNLADIVVELLMTLYEGGGPEGSTGDLKQFVGELDPAPNPPFFSSYVIKATLDYLSKCHSANHKSLVAILSKTPISIQRILLAVCDRAAETTNRYERHRILLVYHLFVNLLLIEVKDGLGGAWAFVLRDVIYTLIHHINSNPLHSDEVSNRSICLCCDLLTSVCRAALQFCDDAVDCHLQVIVGTLVVQVTSRPPPISQQMLRLLQFLIVENQQKLKEVISRLEPFPNLPVFTELRSVQNQLKYSTGTFTLTQEVDHFLSVTSCSSLLLTRLEGLKQLTRQLHGNKGQIKELLRECHTEHANSVLVKLVLSLLQLCKLAIRQPGGADILEAVGSCLGELGPVDFSTIALLHSRDPLYEKSVSLFTSTELQQFYIILNCMNDALTQPGIEVRKAAALCVKNILAAQSGVNFWEQHKQNRDPMLTYLNPFRKAKKKVEIVSVEESSEARKKLENPTLWFAEAGSHGSWLKALSTVLLDSGGVKSEALLLSRPLCMVWVDCCQRLLPLIIHSILQQDSDGSWRELLSSHIQEFFRCCCRAQASNRSTAGVPPNCDAESDAASQSLPDQNSLRTMLAVIDYLRHQQYPVSTESRSPGTVCDSNFWLELNYLEVAKAAQSCSAHFTALLYTEIYVDKLKANMEDHYSSKSRATRRLTFDDTSQAFTISNLTKKSVEDTNISVQELLFEVYRSIGEPDSLYGCGGEMMTSPLTRIRTYEHEALWGKALTSYDLHTSLPEVTRQVGLVEGLQKFGLNSILTTYMKGLESEGVEYGSELRELRFQAAWRNTQWDCELPERNKTQAGFHESVFCSLQALRDKEFSVFDKTMQKARTTLVEELCTGSLEAVSSFYPALRNLQTIQQLENIKQLFSKPFSDVHLLDVCTQWRQQSQLLSDSDFTLVEPIMAALSVALHTLMTKVEDPDSKQYLSSVLTDHLMDLCQLARKAGNTKLAERAVFQMKEQCSGRSCVLTPVSSWQLEEAQVFWAKGEQEVALGLLRRMINNMEEVVDINPVVVPVYTESLRLCGNWLAETCLESPGVILENYLERAVEVITKESRSPQDTRLLNQRTEAFLALARFSDMQYQIIDKYMNSSEFENKQALLKKAKEEVDLIREHKFVSNRYTTKVQKELELDEKALSNLQADKQRFLCKAVENYIQCLEEGEEHDTWVFRLASLWLENGDVNAVNAIMKNGVKKIPSHKFLPLMYQLAARMGTKMVSGMAEDMGFHSVLYNLMCRVCTEHPHHTLFIIFALVNANKDKVFCTTTVSKGVPWQSSPLDLERSEKAQMIINAVKKKRSQLVRGIERLCGAYITLAYMDASRHKTEKRAIPIPADQPIMQIKDLDQVVIPTMELKVDPSGHYDNLVTVRSFMPHYHLAGGVNLPKIIDCVGSDGKSRRQLVKGKDDLRQDAVMQQVFSMCSMLLQRNTDTRKRKLNIRRYKVVPFSQRSGVLEWCSGTVPIGQFLVDPDDGAHKRFRPQDWTNLNCRRKMAAANQGFDEKLQAYSEVCKNFRPVFRYFCMERFLDPAVWMEKRLAYTRSVATSSIVGYIVGLGDRHIQNILIDEQTAELVHIDLGVAFEQGKTLPTPETVPFRLSRDIVDGMGITGVEGVFRRCCEKTLEVMRNSQEALLTIVEVLLYDPLFDWTMNPLKAFYLQRDEQQELNATLGSTMGGENMDNQRKFSDSQSFNKVAERVLLRLQEKLKGVEEGRVLSIGGQVNLLIQQAMDPRNLSRLFPGWQAWV